MAVDLPDGFKETEIGPIPVEWEVVRLQDIAEVVTGRTPSTEEERYWNGSIPFITPVDLQGGPIRDAARTITEEGLQVSRPLPKGSVVVSCIGYIGKIGVVDSPVAVTNQQINAVIPRVTIANNWYLAYALMHMEPMLTSRARVTTVPILSKSNFQEIPVPLPPLPEQRRIAYVLSTIQRAIAAQDALIAAARELKRSLMRHLFTYGPVPLDQADRVPLKETEIGPVPEQWEVVQLGEVVDVKGGKRLPKGHKFADGSTDHPYIRVVDFKNNSVDKTSLRFITPEDYERIKRYTISSKDVYISIAGTTGLVGTVPEDLDGANLTENAAKLVIKDKRRLLNHFLVYALASETGQMEISQRTMKTNQPKLALMRIKQIPTPFPSLAEQRRVADMLSAVDCKIEAEEQRKAALQALFKTMLHQLMSGQIRLRTEADSHRRPF